MAVIRYGALVDGISGSVGGLTFRGTRSGPVLALRGRRLARWGAVSVESRAIMSRIAAGWVALDSDQRLGWVQAAGRLAESNRLGVRRRVGAYELFVRQNVWALSRGAALVEDIPAQVVRWPLGSVTLDLAALKIDVVTSWRAPGIVGVPAGEFRFFGKRTFRGAGRRGGGWVHLWDSAAAGSPHTFALWSYWSAACGAPEPGERFGVRVGFKAAGYLVAAPFELWGVGL